MLSLALTGASSLPASLLAPRWLTSASDDTNALPGESTPVNGTVLDGGEIALLAAWVGLAALAAYLVAVVIGVVLQRAGRRSPLVQSISRRVRRPFRALLVIIATSVAINLSGGTNTWLAPVRWVVGALIVAAAAWLIIGVVLVVEDEVLRRYRVDVEHNRHARRVRTQASFLRRLIVGVVVLVALAVVLLTIPSVKNVGTTILASAGFLSIVAGLAAQSALGNVFAGLQLAFTDALRVEDVVVVESQFGRVEEITLTYIVVRLWDERRMVLPSTYFTTTPFENWTRKDSELIGAVVMDVDWRTDVDGMREELHRVLEEDDLYDGRVGVLQVTDAVGSVVQVRALCSGADAGAVFDLRCHVREALVRWLVSHPAGLPRARQINTEEAELPSIAPLTWPERTEQRTGWELPGDLEPRRAEVGGPSPRPAVSATGKRLAVRGDSLFTGSPEAEARAKQFSGPSEDESVGPGDGPDPRTRLDATDRTRADAAERTGAGAAGDADASAGESSGERGPGEAAPATVALPTLGAGRTTGASRTTGDRPTTGSDTTGRGDTTEEE